MPAVRYRAPSRTHTDVHLYITLYYPFPNNHTIDLSNALALLFNMVKVTFMYIVLVYCVLWYI